MTLHRFKKKQRIGYGWYSRSMAKVMGEATHRTPSGETVVVTLIDEWRGASRMAKWKDLKYVGRVLMDEIVSRKGPSLMPDFPIRP